MWLRANLVLAVAVLFAIVQMFASVTGGPRVGETYASTTAPNGGLTRTVAAQDDNDEDDEDEDNDDEDEDNEDDENDDSDNEDDENDDSDNEDDENDDSDNEDDDSDNEDDENDDSDNEDDEDNEDSDNEDDDSDNEDDADDEDDSAEDELDDELDNVEPSASVTDPTPTTATAPTTAAAPPPPGFGTATSPGASPVASPVPVTEVQLVTTGIDSTLSLQGDRITVQVFGTMPAGITLKLRIVDPLMFPATPGIRAGNLIFQLDAVDAMGVPVSTLPGEVNLSVRYTDVDVVGLDDTLITMSRLNPLDSTWQTAPKLVTDPLMNTLAASVMDTGVYAVYIP